MRGLWICALAAAAAACSDPPRPAPAQVFTMFDLQDLYAQDPNGAVATEGGLPGGVRLDTVLDGGSTLYVRGTLAESYPGKYVTTEVWQGFDALWVQPLYVPVATSDWQAGTLPQNDAGWVFSVGPHSGFYSPFFQVVYVEVPDGTAPGAFKSVREVIDGGYPLHPAGARTVSLVPDDIVAPPAPASPGPQLPRMGTGWLDGKPISFINFGDGNFEWDAAGVIKEIPLFVFLMTGEGGEVVTPRIPTVAGAGPLRSNTPAPPRVDGRPAYSSYWRLYTVRLPPTARVFAPTGTALHDGLTALGVPVVPDDAYSPAAMAATSLAGRVALNPADCFKGDGSSLDPDPTNQSSGRCLWLDSQADIEANLDPTSIEETEITVTCPFVTFDAP